MITETKTIENIIHNGLVIAIIIRNEYHHDGIKFLSDESFSLQIGYMSRPKGYQVIPHIHNPVERNTIGTQEVLFIKKGKIRIDFYSYEQVYLESRTLTEGDVIFLIGAGHGIDILEPAEIFEVKNGPYIEGADKGRFEGVNK
jgi:hypothetical protein